MGLPSCEHRICKTDWNSSHVIPLRSIIETQMHWIQLWYTTLHCSAEHFTALQFTLLHSATSCHAICHAMRCNSYYFTITILIYHNTQHTMSPLWTLFSPVLLKTGSITRIRWALPTIHPLLLLLFSSFLPLLFQSPPLIPSSPHLPAQWPVPPQLITLELSTGSASTSLWRDYTLPLQEVRLTTDQKTWKSEHICSTVVKMLNINRNAGGHRNKPKTESYALSQ